MLRLIRAATDQSRDRKGAVKRSVTKVTRNAQRSTHQRSIERKPQFAGHQRTFQFDLESKVTDNRPESPAKTRCAPYGMKHANIAAVPRCPTCAFAKSVRDISQRAINLLASRRLNVGQRLRPIPKVHRKNADMTESPSNSGHASLTRFGSTRRQVHPSLTRTTNTGKSAICSASP